MKVINERCPFSGECGYSKCEFKFNEAECRFCFGNQMPGKEIADQVPKEAMEFFETEGDNEPSGELVYLDVDKLFPHPDNPRKDLGDLTELKDSIKVSGVLQNLTVVPGHRLSQEEWIKIAKAEGVSKANALGTYNPEEAYTPEGYTIIIGHRRCAAAKEAGLVTVPCIIVEMSIEEQVATMMAENMQRCDLSLREQAEGFQMMMDLGISEADISKRTGFSRTTVKRRLNLLKLDKGGFEKAEARGATLSDYIELDKIKDEKARNKVLGYVGTSSFKWELDRAIKDEEKNACRGELLELVKAFATERTDEVRKTKPAAFVRNLSFTKGEIKNFELPKDYGTAEYYYEETSYGIYLYRGKGEDEQKAFDERAEKEAKRQAEQNEWQNACKEISQRAYNLRLEFVKNYVLKPAHIELVTLWAIKKMMTTYYDSLDTELFEEVTGFKADKDTGNDFQDYESSISDVKKKDELLLKCVYCLIGDNSQHNYFAYHKGEYCENEELDELYEFLCDFGYEMSEEEIALQNGSHEMFEKSDV